MKLYQKFTHPTMFREAALKRAPGSAGRCSICWRRSRRPTSTSSGPASSRWPRPAARRAAGAVSGQLQGHAGSASTISRWLLRRSRDYPLAVELRHRSWSDAIAETLALLERATARPGCRSTSRSSGSRSGRTICRNVTDVLLHAPARPERRRVVASTTPTEDRYNYLYSDDELQPSSPTRRAPRARS